MSYHCKYNEFIASFLWATVTEILKPFCQCALVIKYQLSLIVLMIVSCNCCNYIKNSLGETTATSRMTESDESNPIVTQRRPTFTVKVYQHVEKTPEAGMDVTLQSSMTTLLTSSTSQAEVRLFSEGDTIDNGFETSLDKGKRSVVPKPTKGGAVTKQHHVTPSKDAKKKKHTKKNLKKKAPISPPRSPPPLPPLPPLPVAPPTTDVQSETEREAGKKSRAQTPIAAKTIEIHTPTNKLHNKVATLSPPNTPPPLPPLPPLPTTPLAYQFQSSVSSAQKSPVMIITCSNCGQEIKESRNGECILACTFRESTLHRRNPTRVCLKPQNISTNYKN